MAQLDLKSLSRQFVIQTEAWLRKHRYTAVRIAPGTKAVSSLDKDFINAAKYASPGPADFASGQWGIGVVVGPERHGPVDIDLDCPESIFFADKFLPRTPAIFGRPSKPRSHRLYEIEENELTKVAFHDPILDSNSGNTILEIRADGGHQTVMPGTIHQSGELIQWSEAPMPDVPKVRVDQLVHAANKIAMATLIVRYLWVPGQRDHVNMCISGMLFYFKWSLPEAEEFVRAIMELTGDVEDAPARIKTLRSTFAKGDKNKKIIGATSLKKHYPHCQPAIDRLLEWFGPTTSGVVMELNERFATCLLDGKFRVVHTDVEPGARMIFQEDTDFVKGFGNNYVIGEDGKRISKARYWLQSPQRRFYIKVDFYPGKMDTDDVLNMWTGWAVQPKSNSSCEAWLRLVYSTVCGEDEELYGWLMNWLAHMFQFPMLKPQTCPVIVGVPGAGKTLMCSYLSHILGASYLQVTKPEHVHGRFNSHLRHVLLLHSDEALYARDKRHRAIIKSLITDQSQINEAKGLEANFVRSWVRLLLTSNYDHAAPAEEKDRRYTVIHMQDRKVSESLKDAVVDEMNGDGPAALLHLFLTMACDKEWAMSNVKNIALAEMAIDQTDPIVGWWYGLLQSGLLVPEYLTWATRPADQTWPAKVGLSALYRYFVEEMRTTSRPWGIISREAFSTKLNELTGGTRRKHLAQFYPPTDDEGNIPRWVKEIPGAQRSIIDLPPLRQCREAFECYMGQVLKWDDPMLNIEEPEPTSMPNY